MLLMLKLDLTCCKVQTDVGISISCRLCLKRHYSDHNHDHDSTRRTRGHSHLLRGCLLHIDMSDGQWNGRHSLLWEDHDCIIGVIILIFILNEISKADNLLIHLVSRSVTWLQITMSAALATIVQFEQIPFALLDHENTPPITQFRRWPPVMRDKRPPQLTWLTCRVMKALNRSHKQPTNQPTVLHVTSYCRESLPCLTNSIVTSHADTDISTDTGIDRALTTIQNKWPCHLVDFSFPALAVADLMLHIVCMKCTLYRSSKQLVRFAVPRRSYAATIY